jgi:murein DD-endopeptidase MepM/ murein hydrolase activator NlpD
MKFRFWLALPAAAAAAAGCNGAARTAPQGTTAAVRPADPKFQADLKRFEETRVTWHTIQEKETFFALSQKYGVPVAAIAAANPQLDPRGLAVGVKVAVPGFGPAVGPAPAAVAGPKPPAVKTRDRGRLCYPVVGTARQGQGPTPGVEFAARSGTTVVAAGAGKVVVATPDLGGLGPTVIIDHGNGLCTLYARLADFAVRPDQRVGRGEAIGRAGPAALVFRVYEGPVAQAPGAYLNKR